MDSKILEKHYEKRLEIILKKHCELIAKEKELSLDWKLEHLNKIEKMLEISRQSIIKKEDLEKER